MGRDPCPGDLSEQDGLGNTSIHTSSIKPAEEDGEAMDVVPTVTGKMGPPKHSPEMDSHAPMSNGDATNNGLIGGLSAAAATSSQQPKVVQTAFIHKLYNMLEDPSIQNLISWSNNDESFIMSPTPEFSKVLAQYFKHTNISSFVRQLNMYGFHKVSDVFHTGAPESTLWEFKHGNGNFKRGDLAGLREIKRRASRHALIHRDSFSAPNNHKPSFSQPNTPAEPVLDAGKTRLASLEHSLYDMHARLVRTEESNTALSAKCQALSDSLVKCHQWSLDLTRLVSSFVPDTEGSVRRDVTVLKKDIMQQITFIRNSEDPHESFLTSRRPFFSNMALAEPLSPRQAPSEERRQSLHAIPPCPPPFRTQVPPPNIPMQTPQRRYGSIGTANPIPNYHYNPQLLTQVPSISPQHPLANVQEAPGPNMGRRHTFADIRVPGWPGHANGSPIASAESSGQWPSSPTHAPQQTDSHLQEHLASYTFGAPRRGSRVTTPPLASHDTTPSMFGESNWSIGGGSKIQTRHWDTAPGTRRSSVVSGVHSLLNPAETAEREEEDLMGEIRKRRRVQ